MGSTEKKDTPGERLSRENMKSDELIQWALKKYFDDWEIKRADERIKTHGYSAAIECLRKLAVDSWRGCGGPNMPAYSTRPPFIELWGDDRKSYFDPPQLTIDIEKFCKLKLDNTWQASLF